MYVEFGLDPTIFEEITEFRKLHKSQFRKSAKICKVPIREWVKTFPKRKSVTSFGRVENEF